ncbi:hypothetical protein [Aquirhabdus parva]|uniref:Uncharacterized protein n=1 Tax=Aquirhabdus parva TaxID=2283318 RepID=A0A345P3I8_9GAMM|nr:hypothetical protein [Aquirhabdus parva]AXI01847.1 hypothetical protein HYN46_02510 [Aquirhabdus parva]
MLEEEIKQEIESKKKALNWKPERVSEIMITIIKSSTFNEFEQRKKSLMQKIIDVTKASKKDEYPKKACLTTQKFIDVLDKVKSINAEQYKFMLDEVKSAK